MARPIILSNGRLMVGLDESGLVHDFYYPYVGQENMTSARQMHHRIGVWVDGRFSWLDDGTWNLQVSYEEDALVGRCTFVSEDLKLRIQTKDFVDPKDDIFCRVFEVTNNGSEAREIRLFFHQVFQISRSGRGDTALYAAAEHAYILTYHGTISFVTGLRDANGQPFDQFAVGNYMIEGKSGTFSDAEDGELSGNTVEHGGVDSVIRTRMKLEPGQSQRVDYWVSASAKTYHQATAVHRIVASGGLQAHLESTRRQWKSWFERSQTTTKKVPEKYRDIFKVSMMLIKAHTDSRGGVLASGDSSIYNYGRDYYSYVWPRDAAYALLPLVRLGYTEEALKFLSFCQRVMHPRGYLHHKYMPDGSIGSTWHPMVQEDRPDLNIQVDETAMAVILFAHTAAASQDTLRVEEIYDGLIRPMLHFLGTYIDSETGLPHASYDLWEQKFLSSTYSAAVTIEALRLGIELAKEREDEEDAARWQVSLDTLLKNFEKFFSKEHQYYMKGLRLHHDNSVEEDATLDASTFYGLIKYAPVDKDSAAVEGTVRAFQNTLTNSSPIGGCIRYAGDTYMLTKQYAGNPWFVCTFWLAQYYAASGEAQKAADLVDWAITHSLESGVLSEQIDPENGFSLGVAPLVWSHAELINTVLDIL